MHGQPRRFKNPFWYKGLCRKHTNGREMKIFAVLKEIVASGKETRKDFPCGVKARCVKVLTKSWLATRTSFREAYVSQISGLR
jgi:hypothetical protein